jgi:D-alanine-D-alanine ligase-like ATP-grasp enzyme
MTWWQTLLHRPFFIRLFNWEYWSFHAVYAWIYPVWFFLCLRARSLFFFSASNPTIENGGFLLESKKKIYDILPLEYYPKTLLALPGESKERLLQSVHAAGLVYPLIVKPDIGGKGRGVKKVDTDEELWEYISKFPFDMLVQEFVPYEEEIGIFYYRYPDEERGHISGIVGKHFLKVRGDGRSTIEELLKKKKRYILQLPALKKMMNEELNAVLPAAEERVLVPYGNHARGAMFVDYSDWIDGSLEKVMDEICRRIPGFHYGRLDIRYNSLDKLKQGKEFSIIELNGAGSEPTHMYDPKHSLPDAWKFIIRHWVILWKISRRNHAKGVPYMSYRDGVRMFKETRKYDKVLDSLI